MCDTNRARRASQPNWVNFGVLFLAMAALGATPATNGSSGKLVGIVSGRLLFGLVLYQVYLVLLRIIEDGDEYLRPRDLHPARIVAGEDAWRCMHFPASASTSAATRRGRCRSPTRDPRNTYQQGYFLDYPPGYLYALWAAGVLSRAIGAGGDTLRIIVESPALIADIFLAIVVFAYVRRTEHRKLAMIAMLMVALNPALLFDTVVWGQSDSVLTLVMWLAVVATLAGEYRNLVGARGASRC